MHPFIKYSSAYDVARLGSPLRKTWRLYFLFGRPIRVKLLLSYAAL
jgi:hypothetical protein